MLTVLSWCGRFGRSTTLHIQNFKFLKEMGLKKPAFLPDFGKVVVLTLYHIAELIMAHLGQPFQHMN